MQFKDIQRPINKLPPWFGGQMGVEGSDNLLGLRELSSGVILYVDANHGNANDSNPGVNPDAPKATIQSAVSSALLSTGSIIMVYPGDYAESVETPDYATGPNYVTLMGVGNSRYQPYWASGAVDEPCLDLRAVGWRVTGFRFAGPTEEACIQLRHTDTGANDIAIRTIIEGNLFDGLTTGRYGIVTHGCYDVWIQNNVFQLFHNAVAGGAVALLTGTTPLAIPYRNHVRNNVFWDCDNGAIFPCNGSLIEDNVFQPTGYAYAMTQVLQTSIVANPGDDNIVRGNYFPGDYSVAGGYTAGAADCWSGNLAEDTAEAEVADNGWTVARPA